MVYTANCRTKNLDETNIIQAFPLLLRDFEDFDAKLLDQYLYH